MIDERMIADLQRFHTASAGRIGIRFMTNDREVLLSAVEEGMNARPVSLIAAFTCINASQRLEREGGHCVCCRSYIDGGADVERWAVLLADLGQAPVPGLALAICRERCARLDYATTMERVVAVLRSVWPDIRPFS